LNAPSLRLLAGAPNGAASLLVHASLPLS